MSTSEDNSLVVNLAIAAIQTLVTIVAALIVSFLVRRVLSRIVPSWNKSTPVEITPEVEPA